MVLHKRSFKTYVKAEPEVSSAIDKDNRGISTEEISGLIMIDPVGASDLVKRYIKSLNLELLAEGIYAYKARPLNLYYLLEEDPEWLKMISVNHTHQLLNS